MSVKINSVRPVGDVIIAQLSSKIEGMNDIDAIFEAAEASCSSRKLLLNLQGVRAFEPAARRYLLAEITSGARRHWVVRLVNIGGIKALDQVSALSADFNTYDDEFVAIRSF
jgi:hypothetical protein